jgi:hypothetical protein
MPLLADRVLESSITAGTGTLTLAGALTGYRTFNSAFSNGNIVYYTIDDGLGNWEVGYGTVGTGTLTRSTVLKSSNANALVVFTSVSKRVFCTAPVPALLPDQTGNSTKILSTNGTNPSWIANTVGTVTSVTGTAPVVSSGGVTPAISMAAATGSVNGYLTSTDWTTFNSKGSGTVTAVSVASANGFAGTSSGGATPALTISTSITGVLKGNGTAISAATSGTDYSLGTSALTTGILKSTTATGALTIAIAADFPTLNQNTSGTAAGLSTTLVVGSGGTGLTAVGTSGNVLTSNGTTWASTAPAASGITTGKAIAMAMIFGF